MEMMMNKRLKICINIVIIILALLILVLRLFVFDIVKVKGNSMYPTLNNNDIVVVNKLAQIQNNDIVILKNPIAKGYIIKRVIKSSGNYIYYKNKKIILKSNEFFVMGDNRNQSTDSRNFGIVNLDMIVGVIQLII